MYAGDFRALRRTERVQILTLLSPVTQSIPTPNLESVGSKLWIYFEIKLFGLVKEGENVWRRFSCSASHKASSNVDVSKHSDPRYHHTKFGGDRIKTVDLL